MSETARTPPRTPAPPAGATAHRGRTRREQVAGVTAADHCEPLGDRRPPAPHASPPATDAAAGDQGDADEGWVPA